MKRITITIALTLLCLASFAQRSKPLIGITTSYGNDLYQLRYTYVESVKLAGGIPIILPFVNDIQMAREILANVDGLLLSGGVDVQPLEYGEEPERGLGSVDPVRDRSELLYIEASKQSKLPVLGVCRGHQILNIAYGGTLYQDIPSNIKGALKHSQSIPGQFPSHSILVDKDSHLYSIIGTDSVTVNSFHHQSVKDVAPGFKVTARAKDGVVEGMEGLPTYNVVSVQFHPEYFAADNQDPMWVRLFADLVERAKKH